MPASECVGFGAPWERLSCRPRSPAACDWHELPGRRYKDVWSLPELGFEVYGRGHMANRGWLPLVPVLGHLRKKARALPDLRLPAGCP